MSGRVPLMVSCMSVLCLSSMSVVCLWYPPGTHDSLSCVSGTLLGCSGLVYVCLVSMQPSLYPSLLVFLVSLLYVCGVSLQPSLYPLLVSSSLYSSLLFLSCVSATLPLLLLFWFHFLSLASLSLVSDPLRCLSNPCVACLILCVACLCCLSCCLALFCPSHPVLIYISCIYICMCTYYTQTCTNPNTYIHIHTYAHVCIYTYTHLYMHM